MSESPFTGAGQGFSEMAASCGDVAEQLMSARLQIIETQQGKAAEAAVELIDGHIATLQGLQENCTDMVSACQIQADADSAFSAAPTPSDIEDQRQRTIAAARFGGIAQAQVEDKKLGELVAERDSARVRHAGETTATPPRFPTVEQSAGMRRGSGLPEGDRSDTGGVTLMPLNRPSSSGGGGGGGGMPSLPPMSMADVGTHVSGDTAGAGAARAATTAPMPPQMAPMQMQPAGGMPSGMGAMPGSIPNMQASQRKKDDRGADVATGLSGDGAAAGSGLGAAAAVATGQPDRGSSVTGVRTIADVTGKGSGAVAATAANPNAGAGGSSGGRPPMGGPMGGMGGLGGGGVQHSKNMKPPEIPNRNPDLVGQGTADAAVQGGLIGRASSGKPEPDFGSGESESNPERKAG